MQKIENIIESTMPELAIFINDVNEDLEEWVKH